MPPIPKPNFPKPTTITRKIYRDNNIIKAFISTMLITIIMGALLIWIIYPIWHIETMIIEMNNRQKTIVVTQHKAIEDMIRDVCKR